MKRIPFALIIVVSASSCTVHSLSSQGYVRSAASEYCNLLHVPSMPPSTEPKPYLGIYLATRTLEQSFPSCGNGTFVRVDGVIEGTPAAEAGLKEGDVILSFNNHPTCREKENILASFKKMIEKQEIDSMVEMDIQREEKKLSLTAKLRKRPTHFQPEAEHRDIEECLCQPSRLQTALDTQGAVEHFNKVTSGLFHQSTVVHNPGLSYEEGSNPFQLREMTYLLRHPLSAGAVAKEISQKLISSLREQGVDTEELVRKSAELLDISLPRSREQIEITFPGLIRIMGMTKNKVEQSLSRLAPEEKDLLYNKTLNPWDDSKWNTIIEISRKVDLQELMSAFTPLLAFLKPENLPLLKKDLLERFGKSKESLLFEEMPPAGKVIVGGVGPNVYQEDAALIIDLGGDDIYLNNAGGTRPGMPVALVIDFEGNDRYISKENFSQGAGVLGGGFLLDLSGNDTFISLDGSQGAGFWGIGFLYHGDGNGVYTARKFSQGTGQMGIGLIVNRKGNDGYLCSYGGQGLGLFKGAGILIDEAGNDHYQLGGSEPDFRDPLKSTLSMGQGFGQGFRPEKGKNGVPGGIGILIDKEGDDTYIADYFAEGSSYYYGVGILNDIAGNDQYLAGRYVQGAGIHSSVGIFIDQGGDDFYYASYGVAQGVGHDFGVGYFEDDEGHNRYWGGTLIQGATTDGSLGIFMDLEGIHNSLCIENAQGSAGRENGIGVMVNADPSHDLLPGKSSGKSLIRLGLGKAE